MDNLISIRRTLCLFALLFAVLGWQSQLHAVETKGNQAVSAEATSTININKASASEIAAALTGIGEKRAEAIVAYRQKNGAFTSLEELMNVKGVGEKMVEKNASRISF
jgi:competence protein ComEA